MIADSINASNVAAGITETAKSGNQLAYLILLPAYLMIVFFAFKGHKYRKW